MKKILLLLLLTPVLTFAQEDLLSGLDSVPKNEITDSAFKALKIVNLESTKLAAKKELYFIVAHRFGSVEGGFESFFGLDNAVTQIKFEYGLTQWLTLAAGRSEQAYDVSAKYRLWPQMKNGFPVSIVVFNSVAFNNLLKENNLPKLEFSDRMSYVSQLLISRKFSDRFSLELAPSFLHENFVSDDNQANSQFIMGMGGRLKVSKRVSINLDYAAHANRASGSPYKNPLSVGVDIDTGGHVFQMHFTNSQGMHEAGFLGNTTGDWGEGDIYFGFNLSRVF
ncbi:MAG TPA: DUF5777 family beta-barrel protein [Flavobacterium sp.]|jgi:hypothetical protein|nr:DUF5777 family beta-barrel protein [Flavobacterium sp.]HPJ10907.1 DUF5777 family beta-barrel protein [Flavobacterium sp.]